MQRIPSLSAKGRQKLFRQGLAEHPDGQRQSVAWPCRDQTPSAARRNDPLFDLGRAVHRIRSCAALQSLSLAKSRRSPSSAASSSTGLHNGPAVRARPKKGWAFVRELKPLYDVKILSGEPSSTPDLGLLLVHPKNLSVRTQFPHRSVRTQKGSKTVCLLLTLCACPTYSPAAGVPELSSTTKIYSPRGDRFRLQRSPPTRRWAHASSPLNRAAKQQQVIFPPYINVDSRGLNKRSRDGKVTSINFAMAGWLAGRFFRRHRRPTVDADHRDHRRLRDSRCPP